MPEEPTQEATLTEDDLLRLSAVRVKIRKREEKLQTLTGVRTGSYFRFSGNRSAGNRSNTTEETALKRDSLRREIQILFPEFKTLTEKTVLYIDANYPTGQAGFLIDIFCFGISAAHARKVHCLRRSEAEALPDAFLSRIRGTDNAGNEEAGRSPADTDPDKGTSEADTRSRQAPAD